MAIQYRITLNLTKEQYDEVERIAKKEDIRPGAAARDLIVIALKYWDKYKKEQND